MVTIKELPKFLAEVKELYGFLMSQEIAISPLTPVDTSRMARSFPATYKFTGDKIEWTTPYYTKFLEEGTSRMQARRFIKKIFHQKSKINKKKAFKIVNRKYL